MEMVKVVDCSVTDCAYNVNKQCHTIAITVGSDCARCDAYMHSMNKGGEMDVTGEVGSCHMADCQFNQSLECNAPGIHVAKHSGHADCNTYKMKK
jgi:hypothetical protein